MIFTKFVILFSLPLIPTILFYWLFKEKTVSKVRGKVGSIVFTITGAGATYAVFLILIFYLYSRFNNNDKEVITLRLRLDPPKSENAEKLYQLSRKGILKIELHPENETPIELNNFEHKPGQEFLERRNIEIPKKYFGENIEYKILPTNLFEQTEKQAHIKKTTKVIIKVNEEKLNYLSDDNDKIPITLQLLLDPPCSLTAQMLYETHKLKIKFYPDKEETIIIDHFKELESEQEFLEGDIEIPRKCYGKKIEYEIHPHNFVKKAENQIFIKRLIKIRMDVRIDNILEFRSKQLQEGFNNKEKLERKHRNIAS